MAPDLLIYLSLLLLCSILIYRFRSNYIQIYRPWLGLVLTAFICEFTKYFVTEPVNYQVNHLYQLAEIALMVWLYSLVLNNNLIQKNRNLIISTLVILSILSSTFLDGWENDNYYSFHLGSITTIILVMAWYYQLFTRPPTEENLLRLPFFWINTGNLFFYTGTYFYMGLIQFLGEESPHEEKLKLIMKAMNYLLYLLYIAGTLCRKTGKE